MNIRRAITKPIRENASWDERWKGADNGLIACWERGRQKAIEDPDLVKLAQRGQLVPLPWKGGVEKVTKDKTKFGSLNYLAMWQGLRGDDLSIDPDRDVELTCSVTDMKVVFTRNLSKLEND